MAAMEDNQAREITALLRPRERISKFERIPAVPAILKGFHHSAQRCHEDLPRRSRTKAGPSGYAGSRIINLIYSEGVESVTAQCLRQKRAKKNYEIIQADTKIHPGGRCAAGIGHDYGDGRRQKSPADTRQIDDLPRFRRQTR